MYVFIKYYFFKMCEYFPHILLVIIYFCTCKLFGQIFFKLCITIERFSFLQIKKFEKEIASNEISMVNCHSFIENCPQASKLLFSHNFSNHYKTMM